MTDKRQLGLYVHFPFCAVKCPYCDFYSCKLNASVMDSYAKRAAEEIRAQKEKYGCVFDTVYFGGGTPSIMGAKRLITVAKQAVDSVTAEFTVECNTSMEENFFESLSQVGVNRVSIGLQSAVDEERAFLGRKGTPADVKRVADMAKKAGIENISFDMMIGLPNQTSDSLKRSVDFCYKNEAKHVSAYLLKVEENTPFYEMKDTLDLPDEDKSSELYLETCELLRGAGYGQYEISNFALPGYEGKHNLRYWHCEEYIGIGPAAHSFIDGKRFYYERDLNGFLENPKQIIDSEGGDFEEFAMLALRLAEGLTEKRVRSRFGHGIPESMRKQAELYEKKGLLKNESEAISLTEEGFLVSNALIAALLYD